MCIFAVGSEMMAGYLKKIWWRHCDSILFLWLPQVTYMRLSDNLQSFQCWDELVEQCQGWSNKVTISGFRWFQYFNVISVTQYYLLHVLYLLHMLYLLNMLYLLHMLYLYYTCYTRYTCFTCYKHYTCYACYTCYTRYTWGDEGKKKAR